MSRSSLTPLLAALLFSLSSASALAQAPRDTPERRLALTSSAEELELPERRTAARSIGFDEGLQLLHANNLDLEVARASIAQAAILEAQARGLFSPTLNVAGSVTLNDREVSMSQGSPLQPLLPYLDSVYDSDPSLRQYLADTPGAVDARDLAGAPTGRTITRHRMDYRAQATFTQPIYAGRFFANRRLATIAEQQAYASVEQTAFHLQQAFTQLYFQAVTLDRFIAISEANVANARLTLQRARILFEEDAGTEFDLTRAEVTLLTALRDYENTLTAHELAIEAIATLLRITPDFEVAEPETLAAPEDLDTLLDLAATHRPELELATLDIEQQQARIADARARFQPTVYAMGQATLQRVTAFSGRAFTWNVSLNASWNLLDGGAARRDRRSAEISASQAELRREQLLDSIRSEIRQAWLTMRRQDTIITRARIEAELARTNLDLTTEARELGAASALEVDIAQNQLYQAELALAEAEIQHRAAIYELYRLQGNAWSLNPGP